MSYVCRRVDTSRDKMMSAGQGRSVAQTPVSHGPAWLQVTQKGDAVHVAPVNDLDMDYTPRYIRLARVLRQQIEDGTYPRGSLLPSSTRLAASHAVSTATALHALEMLVSSGYARHVESKPHQVIWLG